MPFSPKLRETFPWQSSISGSFAVSVYQPDYHHIVCLPSSSSNWESNGRIHLTERGKEVRKKWIWGPVRPIIKYVSVCGPFTGGFWITAKSSQRLLSFRSSSTVNAIPFASTVNVNTSPEIKHFTQTVEWVFRSHWAWKFTSTKDNHSATERQRRLAICWLCKSLATWSSGFHFCQKFSTSPFRAIPFASTVLFTSYLSWILQLFTWFLYPLIVCSFQMLLRHCRDTREISQAWDML